MLRRHAFLLPKRRSLLPDGYWRGVLPQRRAELLSAGAGRQSFLL
jgi:hypothetical protein